MFGVLQFAMDVSGQTIGFSTSSVRSTSSFPFRIPCLIGLLFAVFFYHHAGAACTANVSGFPYAESFENGAAGWITGGTNSDWILGAPSKPVINSAGNGNNCWVTGGLTGSFYAYSQRSWLQSPCFDFSSLLHPEIKFLIFWDTEYQYDGGSLQYSLDGGITWRTLGSNTTPACVAENWFNLGSINNLSGLSQPSCGWSGTVQPTSGSCRGGNGSGGWKTASFCLPDLAGESSVTFRFTFGSGSTCNDFDGLAVDFFQVENVPSVVTSMSFQCQSSRTVVFTDNQPDCRSNRTWDFGDGTTDNNGATSVSHTYLSEGVYQIILYAEHSCRGNEQTVARLNLLNYTATTTPVSCNGSTDGTIVLQMIPAGLPNAQVNWSEPGLNGTNLTGLPAGNYIFQLSAQAACSFSDTLQIGESTSALVYPDLGPDRLFCPGSNSQLHPSGGKYSFYLWQDGSTDSVFTVTTEGDYWVEVTNSSGCTGTDTVRLDLNCLLDPIFPSAFTPNGDGKNDVFAVFEGQWPIDEWLIYDRWGGVIFSTRNTAETWTGTGCPEGVYVCLIRYHDENGNSLEKNGRVTLIR